MKTIKVIKVRRYKAGYEVRTELVDCECGPDSVLEMKNAYTPTGDYIGDSTWAHRLVKVHGIKPEKSEQEHCVCSIGFCEKEQKWYGWGMAIYGFGVGSKIKKGDCGYIPSNPAQIIKDLIEDEGIDPSLVTTCNKGKAVRIEHKMVYTKPVDPGEPEGQQIIDSDRPDCPPDYQIIECGRGEWEAKTMEDARQMAVDFAAGVS